MGAEPYSNFFAVIDVDGYRPNVGIIVTNPAGLVLWAKRVRQDAWQFPQGGIQREESPEQAMFRELHEELGLTPAHVRVLGHTEGWLKYRLPLRYIRPRRGRLCIGQKQKWFALRLVGEESLIRFDQSPTPEFDGWRWVPSEQALNEVVEFKRDVYRRAIEQLSPVFAAA